MTCNDYLSSNQLGKIANHKRRTKEVKVSGLLQCSAWMCGVVVVTAALSSSISSQTQGKQTTCCDQPVKTQAPFLPLPFFEADQRISFTSQRNPPVPLNPRGMNLNYEIGGPLVDIIFAWGCGHGSKSRTPSEHPNPH